MVSNFPVVGVLGEGALARMMIPPGMALGIDLQFFTEDFRHFEAIENFSKNCSIMTFAGEVLPIPTVRMLEIDGVLVRPNSAALKFCHEWDEGKSPNQDPPFQVSGREFSVMVARSPHGQASAWTPTEVIREGSQVTTLTPPPEISNSLVIKLQKLALDLAHGSGVVGVMDVEVVVRDGEIIDRKISLGPTNNGRWSIEGSRTSQFEQHLRAILDLPLGDPSLISPFAVSGSFLGDAKSNMYRPYLHLMARSPRLKFHQYRPKDIDGEYGHVTAVGNDLLDLRECIAHAIDYMSGVVDE